MYAPMLWLSASRPSLTITNAVCMYIHSNAVGVCMYVYMLQCCGYMYYSMEYVYTLQWCGCIYVCIYAPMLWVYVCIYSIESVKAEQVVVTKSLTLEGN